MTTPESFATIGVSFAVVLGVVSIVRIVYGNGKVCEYHASLLSRIAGMQSACQIIATYSIERATKEGRDLLNEVIELLSYKEKERR